MLTRTLSRSLPHAGNARRALATNAYMRSTEKMESVLDRLAQHRACAVLRTPTAEAAPKAMNAAIDGGFKLVEFTLTTPGCLDCVSDFRAKQGGRLSKRSSAFGQERAKTLLEAELGVGATDAGATDVKKSL